MSATIPGAAGSGEEALYWNGSAWVTISPVNQANIDAQNTNSLAYFGSTSSNAVTLGSNNDFADGRANGDTIDGGDGNDILVGGAGFDSLTGGQGADTLIGGAATVTGSLDTGSFTITAADDGFSVDNLVGGEGDDTFIVTNTSDSINGGNGTDTVLITDNVTSYTLNAASGVENVGLFNPASAVGRSITAAGTGSQAISGGAGGDTLNGGDGADTLSGLGGNNVLNGGEGDDRFIVDGTTNNTVTGGNGSDDAISFSNAGTYTVVGDSGTFTITGAGGTQVVSGVENISGAGGDSILGAGSFDVCFAPGTRILTAKGEVEVERLQAGDLVATLAGNGTPMKPVLWIGRRRVVLAGQPNAAERAPVRIRAGALSENTPHRDLVVSPDHCLFLDGALVPARLLVNGRSITVERGVAEVTWFHVELEGHDVLLAEGAAAESWLDCANRSWFENAAVARLAVPGDLAAAGTGWDANRACAPLLHGGEQLAAIRAGIAARAEAPAETVPQVAAA